MPDTNYTFQKAVMGCTCKTRKKNLNSSFIQEQFQKKY